MDVQYNDGGREAAGYKGAAGDCVVRAIAIATETDYKTVYDALTVQVKSYRGKRPGRAKNSVRNGVPMKIVHAYLIARGWHWTPTMHIGSRCTVHMRREELPAGRLIVRLSCHVAAVIDGVLHDTHYSDRNGTRCVYGYFAKG